MKLFLKKIKNIVVIIISIWIIHMLFLLLNFSLLSKTNKLYHKQKSIDKKTIFILGNSHPESAINDILLGDDYINISKSAEPLFYTAIKARNIINRKLSDTLIIEFGNLGFQTIHYVLDDDKLFENYKTYFSLMSIKEHQFLFKNNFKKALKTLIFINLKDIKKYNIINGGYIYYEADNIVSPNKKYTFPKQRTSDYKYPVDIQKQNVEALLNLINNNKSTFFIIVRMPVHKSKKIEDEELYNDYVNQLKKFKNCTYINFNNQLNLPDSCFGDKEHLNFKGAKVFTPFFKSQILLLRNRS